MPIGPPYTDPTTDVSAALTNRGRELCAKRLLGLLNFQFHGFKVGQAGYDYTTPNPLSTIPVNPAATDLEAPIFPVTGYQPFVTIEFPYPNIAGVVCRLNNDEANYGLGEIGIWANIISSTDPSYPVGTKVLFAQAHHPLTGKTRQYNFVRRFLIAA